MRKPRKNDTPVEKVAILRRHRIECATDTLDAARESHQYLARAERFDGIRNDL
jgi:hypothetical protein